MILTGLSMLAPSVASADVLTARQTELLYLLKHDCGSCHGMTLQGGLGPALTPQALNGKSEVMLRDTILNGRSGTPMPPWRAFMNTQEAEWLVQMLQRGTTDAK
jgi:cytochrome c55X